VFASYSSSKGLIFRIYAEFKKLNLQRINIPMKKWVHELNREFSRKRYKWPINIRRSIQLLWP
jgi:hypothetical protein